MANSTIEEIRERLNIVDVVSSYIPLKKSGTNYKANCPFHKENSASCMISPSKQIWHCFGCGEGGDVFGFVMKYENVDFGEALKILAERAGVQLPKYTAQSAEVDQHKQTLMKINDLTARFYHRVLLESPLAKPARDYLQQRGLKSATIQEWEIGFAPDGFHTLEQFLQKKDFKPEDLIKAGVCSAKDWQSKKNAAEIYDRFVNRITFPIKNYSGDTVGFTARILDSKAQAAKYVNSPETDIYHKSKVIFGLYQAKQAIRKEGAAVVVEGNMDVISCHQAGFKNVVGSSGTAFTYDQLQTLSRLTKTLKFSFDTDNAGLIATRRAVELALQLGFSVSVVKISGAKDPDELIKKDPKLFREAIDQAQPYLDFFFEKSFEGFNPQSVEQKKKISAELIPLLRKLRDPLEIDHYAKMLAGRLGVGERTVYELISKERAASGTREEKIAAQPAQQSSEPLIRTRLNILEEKLLGMALYKEQYKEEIFSKISPEQIQDQRYRRILQLLQASSIDLEQFIANLPEEDQQLAKLAVFMVESEYSTSADHQNIDGEFPEILQSYKDQNTKAAMGILISEMALAEQQKDKQKLEKLNREFLELSKQLKVKE